MAYERKPKKKDLVILEGCKECLNRKCQWNGSVASPDIAKVHKTKYSCHTDVWSRI